jgi:hypothetical protein
VKTSTRWLMGFGAGFLALIIVTLTLVFTLGQNSQPLLPANDPEGALQRYLLAVGEKDYITAYKYLDFSGPISPGSVTGRPVDGLAGYPEVKGPPGFYDFFLTSARNTEDVTWKATIEFATKTVGVDKVSFSVKVEGFRHQAPIGAAINTHDVNFSVKLVDGSWLITSPLDMYWIY